jgi:hypothetical protein
MMDAEFMRYKVGLYVQIRRYEKIGDIKIDD